MKIECTSVEQAAIQAHKHIMDVRNLVDPQVHYGTTQDMILVGSIFCTPVWLLLLPMLVDKAGKQQTFVTWDRIMINTCQPIASKIRGVTRFLAVAKKESKELTAIELSLMTARRASDPTGLLILI